MPIRKGEPWGSRGAAPVAPVLCADDAAVADAVWAARGVDRSVFVSIAAGDLLKTLGGTEGVVNSTQDSDGTVLLLPIDLCIARLDDGEPMPFVAHLVARHRGWHGEGAAAMNAAWVDDWYLGPRSHPNDGLVDTTVGSLPVRERREASRRAKLGSHLPHPGLTTKRGSSWTHEFSRPTPVLLDGTRRQKARRITVEVETDAFTVVL